MQFFKYLILFSIIQVGESEIVHDFNNIGSELWFEPLQNWEWIGVKKRLTGAHWRPPAVSWLFSWKVTLLTR